MSDISDPLTIWVRIDYEYDSFVFELISNSCCKQEHGHDILPDNDFARANSYHEFVRYKSTIRIRCQIYRGLS